MITTAPPITYIPNFVPNPDEALHLLQTELTWERRDTTPRSEYYCNDVPKPYVYGRGRGVREYQPQPYHKTILEIRKALEDKTNSVFEVCFLNFYRDQTDQLGWHADDSPEMDDARPIGIVSLGVEREIWFRPILNVTCSCCNEKPPCHKMSCYVRNSTRTSFGEVTKVKLQHGSLCIMGPGMQDNWQHRIPKTGFTCGERISLTFRGYVGENQS